MKSRRSFLSFLVLAPLAGVAGVAKAATRYDASGVSGITPFRQLTSAAADDVNVIFSGPLTELKEILDQHQAETIRLMTKALPAIQRRNRNLGAA